MSADSAADLFGAAAGAAFHRGRALLFPVRLAPWSKLLFLFLLSGGCGGPIIPGLPGGGDRESSRSLTDRAQPADVSEPANGANGWVVEPLSSDDGAEMTATDGVRDPVETSAGEPNGAVSVNPGVGDGPIAVEVDLRAWSVDLREWARAWWTDHRGVVIAAAAGVGLILVAAVLILMWLAARLKLTVIGCLSRNRVAVRAEWRRTRALGWSFFKLNLLLMLVAATGAAALAGLAFVLREGAIGLGVVIAGAFVGVLAMIPAFVVYGLVWSFLPVVMERREETAWGALRRIGRYFRRRPGGALLLLLLYGAMAIALYTAVMIAALLITLLIGLPLIAGGALIFGWAGAVGGFNLGTGLGLLIAFAGAALAVLLTFLAILLFVVPAQTYLHYLRIELVERA